MTDLAARIAQLSPQERNELAKLLRRSANVAHATPADRGGIEPVPRDGGHVPMSFTQERIWFLEQFDPGTPFHNVSGVARIPLRVEPGLFRDCIEEVVARHEILRTRFVMRDGEPVGVVEDRVAIALEVLPELPDSERERLFALDAQRPFDLREAPLLRVSIAAEPDGATLVQLTMHHIVSDGFSTGVFFRELGELYRLRLAGIQAGLPPLPFQFADVAAWERRRAGDRSQTEAIRFWADHLRAAPHRLSLPADRPRPARMTNRGGRLLVDLPPALSAQVQALSQSNGVTPFVTMLAGFVVTLSRYASQDDLIVGVPVANREQRGVEQLIGPFLNTLALRFSLAGAPTFTEVVQQVNRTFLAGLEHQQVPFDRVLQAVQDDRDPSRSPLFQVVFNFQTDQAAGQPGSQLRDLHNGGCDFDLLVNIVSGVGGMTAHIDYYADAYSAAGVARFAGALCELMRAAAADPGLPVTELPLVAPDGYPEILARGSGPVLDYDHACRVHDLVLGQARRDPARVALIEGDRQYTYGEIGDRSAAVGAQLRRQVGAPAGAPVAICLPRSADMVIAILGVLRAGLSYLPLDPGYPPARLAFICGDAGAVALVTRHGLDDVIPAVDRPTILMDEIDSVPIDDDTGVAVPTGECAYTIYTSGSIDQAKAVQVSHRNVVNLLLSMRERPGPAPDDVLLAATSPSFDIAVLEMLLPLTSGARAVIASPADVADGRRLAGLIEAHQVTVMPATPATWQLMLASGWHGRPALRALCGGESFSPALAAALLARCGEVWNMYGPTETAIWSTIHRVNADDPPDGSIPIGRPIANTTALVLDAGLNPVPQGVLGELCLGGDGVAIGYHRRPDLTAARFVVPPSFAGQRVYRTGDLVRVRADGTIQFVGRNDDQVKVRNGLPGPDGIAQTGPDQAGAAPSGPVAPRTETEQALADIWRDLLGLPEVGVMDSFFELGGHSLLATKLVFRIHEALGADLPLTALFDGEPTIARLAALIDDGACADGGDDDTIDLVAEARLADDIRPQPGAHVHSVEHPANILLTGATGFVGAFLLAELLRTTEATAFCLVRAASAAEGRERIRDAMTEYDLWDPALADRVIPVPGTLSLPRFGLCRPQWQHLAEMVDVIYHCGAEVNFLQKYRALKPANVSGTEEVLRLACRGPVKPVHFVSTLFVFSRFSYPPGTDFSEDDLAPVHDPDVTFGYTQSKWVSEQLVLEAGRRGLPVTVHRLGRAAGHSRTGACQSYDFVWQVTKVGIEMGAAPIMDMTLDLTPVDYLASALVHLSRQPASLGKVFHLLSPHEITEAEFVAWLERYGYRGDRITFRDWCDRVIRRAAELSDRTAGALAPFLAGTLPLDRMPAARYDQSNVERGLAGSAISCPPLAEELLHTYLGYFRDSGFLPAPTGAAPVADTRPTTASTVGEGSR